MVRSPADQPPADPASVAPQRSVAFEAWTAPLVVELSFGAAAIHFAVIGEHFAEFVPYGVLFAGLAWFQVGWGTAYLLRPEQRLALVAMTVNVGAMAVWLVSRTAGLPIGPAPGEIEPVGDLDLLATTFELALVGLLALRFPSTSRRANAGLSRSRATAAFGVTSLVVLVMSTAALAAPNGSHGPGTHLHDDAHAHGPTALPSAASSATAPASSPAASGSPSLPSPTAGASPSPAPATASSGPRGTITFGARFDIGGALVGPSSTFRIGATAAWVAQLKQMPATPALRSVIVEPRADGRMTAHWNQEIAIADPVATRVVGMADLSAYAHGGPGTYLLRYLGGDQILAEGAFTLVP